MANKKQSQVVVIILIAIVVVAAFFIVRAVRPPRPPAMPMPEYFVCMEGCQFRVSGEEVQDAGLINCPECGAPLMPDMPGMIPPELMPLPPTE